MGKRVVTFCDLCDEEVSYDNLSKVRLPVLVHVINEYGRETHTRVDTVDMELCEQCMERTALMETNAGAVCPVDGEGVYRMRKTEVD